MSELIWVKGKRSGSNGCVEVAVTPNGVAVRNSRDPQGPILEFEPTEWDAFKAGVRDGEFDLD